MPCKHLLVFLLILISAPFAVGQSLQEERKCNWEHAGVRDSSTADYELVSVLDYALVADGTASCDSALLNLFADHLGKPIVVQFDAGVYLFNEAIVLPDHCVLRGKGAGLTQLRIEHGGSGDGIVLKGGGKSTKSRSLTSSSLKGSNQVLVDFELEFEKGDWIQFSQSDTDLMHNDWAYGSYGQICQIEEVDGKRIILRDTLRLDLVIERNALATRVDMLEGSGIECLQIKRIDSTAPEQSSTIRMEYAANCWVKGVQSDSCTFGHITAIRSSHLGVTQSYFQHGFTYGGGGRAYGVVLEFTTGDCRVENNVFNHLRHAVLFQAASNGNLVAYNAVYNSFWEDVNLPADAAGDLVLHGNYPFLNLFEQNLCNNIVIDNSHGVNGPHNTFLRNRAVKWGVFFSDSTSPSQNILGNEITNTDFPYSALNYRLLGKDHYAYGNLVRGKVQPDGTDDIADSSFGYTQIPAFLEQKQWLSYGLPKTSLDGEISAGIRWDVREEIAPCEVVIAPLPHGLEKTDANNFLLFPNPASNQINLYHRSGIRTVRFFDMHGKLILERFVNSKEMSVLNLELGAGAYLIRIETFENSVDQKIFVVKR